MESIYYVLTWLCHRTCPHCYDDRFHPYHGNELRAVVDQSAATAPSVIDNLPRASPTAIATTPRTPGQCHLAGGAPRLRPRAVLYPALRQLHAKYRAHGGVSSSSRPPATFSRRASPPNRHLHLDHLRLRHRRIPRRPRSRARPPKPPRKLTTLLEDAGFTTPHPSPPTPATPPPASTTTTSSSHPGSGSASSAPRPRPSKQARHARR